MRGGRLIVVAGVLMGLIAGVLVILMVSQNTPAAAAPEPTREPPSVVRAAQNIAKGDEIAIDAVQLVRLQPGEPLPPNTVRDPMSLVGMTAAVDIPQGTVIQEAMSLDREALVQAGQSAAMLFGPGLVAMAMPVGVLGSVAGAVSAGDHIDIIAALDVVEVDPEIQALLPLEGNGIQIPRSVVQLTLQNIEVLRVGPWGAGPADPTRSNAGTGTASLLTVVLPQQDALVLDYLLGKVDQGQARMTVVLRAADDGEIVAVDAVTLDYIMKRFGIVVPAKTRQATAEIRVKGSVEPR